MPVIPDILSRLNVEGVVELNVLVDDSGHVEDIKVSKSIPVVDTACINAAKLCRFRPGQLADESGKYLPASFWTTVSYDWKYAAGGIVR